LLEGDEGIIGLMKSIDVKVVKEAEIYAKEIEELHGEPRQVVMASERYTIAHKISREVQTIAPTARRSRIEKIDDLITHKALGYIIMMVVVGSAFYAVFSFGSILSEVLGGFFDFITPSLAGLVHPILWEGAYGGFVAGITLVLPYVLPFYIILALLEDSGYLPRVAFLLDGIMHKMGLHGKAVIPLIMGYGCNVPACYSCRIMETKRDRLIAAFVVTFIPCTARLVVIFGLVGAFVGLRWVVILLLMDLIIAFLVGRLAFKALPGESVGLVMELHPLRVPSLRVVLPQVWARIKSILYIVFPLYIGGGAILALAQLLGLLKPIEFVLSPITEGWLGLPAFASTLLIFGMVRKELVIITPALLFGTTDLGSLFTPTQMVVLAFIAMIYVPCLATFSMLKREFGWKVSAYISIFELVLTIALAGLFYRSIQLLG
ncbi:MAG: ferrous iron transporter B, partial [Nitrososphaerota archaeon]